MHAQAHDIINALNAAFGGASQYSYSLIGAAIFGRANNAPRPWSSDKVRDLISAARAVIVDYWGEEVDISEVSNGYREAREKAQGTHAPEI